MKKEVFDSIIEKANGSPCIVYGDNMMLFAVGFEGNYYVQDDECVYCIRTNKMSGGNVGISQQESPYELVAFDYDMIQYVKIFPTTEVIMNILDSATTMTDEMTIDEMKKAIGSSKLLGASSARGFTGAAPTVNEYGVFEGSAVTVGKEPDKWLQKVQEDFNKSQKI